LVCYILDKVGLFIAKQLNGRVSDKPRRLLCHQRAQAHNSTHYRCQLSFMYWIWSKQNCLLCAYEHDFGDNFIITIVKTGITTKKYVIVLSVLNLVSYFVKCNHPIGSGPWSLVRFIWDKVVFCLRPTAKLSVEGLESTF
jgi:hypothetical protein